MAGQMVGGKEYLERGLGLFATRGQNGRVFNVGNRIISELNQRGLSKEAKEISDYVKGLLPDFAVMAGGSMESKRPALPTHCPGCGAPVRPDEVEWLDDLTAECAFCGSPGTRYINRTVYLARLEASNSYLRTVEQTKMLIAVAGHPL